MIDYERAKKENPKLKAALTRATKISDPIKRYKAVLTACEKAVQTWALWGAWPDAWSTWQRALNDATFEAQRAGAVNLYLQRLEEL
jgi:hypothetical protein